jgi:hypothetical protein
VVPFATVFALIVAASAFKKYLQESLLGLIP